MHIGEVFLTGLLSRENWLPRLDGGTDSCFNLACGNSVRVCVREDMVVE